jgi:hypothetical protein
VILISKTRDWVAWIPVFSSTTPAMQERKCTRARERGKRARARERARENDRKSEEESAAPEKGRVKSE